MDKDEYDDFYNGRGSISALQSALPENLEHVPFDFTRLPEDQSIQRAKDFYIFMNTRRTIRHFSKDPVSPEIIRYVIRTAGTAPSGAHTEPWTYVAVSDPEIKAKIREIIEEEEQINYTRRMGKKWLMYVKKKITFLGKKNFFLT